MPPLGTPLRSQLAYPQKDLFSFLPSSEVSFLLPPVATSAHASNFFFAMPFVLSTQNAFPRPLETLQSACVDPQPSLITSLSTTR